MKKHGKLFIPLISLVVTVLIAGAVVTTVFPNLLRPRQERKRFDASFLELFDTVSTIVGYDESKEAFTEFSQDVHDTLLAYHNLYDIYHETDVEASIKTINDNAGIKPVQVDKRIIDLLKLSKDLYQITGGRTNVAFGAVLSIWHTYREEGIDDPQNASLPPMDELRDAAKHTNIDDVIIDEEAGTVYLADPEMSLDVGAIAKGYATEQSARIIEESGRTNVLLSIGGNVRAIGAKPDGSPWNVGIENPDKESEQGSLFTLNIDGLSVVTSGAYHRYYTVDGVVYHHIIDPDTLMPADYFASVVVVTKDSGIADGLSTGLYCMPLDEGMKLVESLDHTEACWIFFDGTIEMTDGFRALIKE
jgi:thiamine biosynthesis lipoprotein